jgi:hypothetical protein
MELSQGQEQMVSNLGEPSNFFLDLALCPEPASTHLVDLYCLYQNVGTSSLTRNHRLTIIRWLTPLPSPKKRNARKYFESIST